jgi:type I restriction enzyme S subunit
VSRWRLPDSWEWTKLGEIAEIVGGGTPRTSDPTNFKEDGIPWLTPADLTGYAGEYVTRGARSLSPKGLAESSAHLLPAGAVLFTSRAPIGYCVIAQNEIATNQGFKSLILRGDVDPRYIRYYLIASKEYAESRASGSTFKELSGRRMAELDVPIPPLSEQRRIVNKIGELRVRVRRVATGLGEVPQLLARSRESLLASAFRGDLTEAWRASRSELVLTSVLENRVGEGRQFLHTLSADGVPRDVDSMSYSDAQNLPKLPDNWSWASLESLADPQRGIPYGIVQTGREHPDGVPTIRGGDLKDFTVMTDQLKRVDPAVEQKYVRTRLKGGEVLVAIRGTVGATAVVEGSMAGMNISREVAMVPVIPKIDPRYLMYAMGSPDAQARILGHVKGIAQAGINLTDLRALAIPIAPHLEQHVIVKRLDAAWARIQGLQRAISELLLKLQIFEQSVLTKAFRGELVPQDHSEEPAAQVISRINNRRDIEVVGLMKTKKRRMVVSKPSTEALRGTILESAEGGVSFAQLREICPGDYDTLKGAVFGLLAGDQPLLAQQFDASRGVMVLRRVKQ